MSWIKEFFNGESVTENLEEQKYVDELLKKVAEEADKCCCNADEKPDESLVSLQKSDFEYKVVQTLTGSGCRHGYGFGNGHYSHGYGPGPSQSNQLRVIKRDLEILSLQLNVYELLKRVNESEADFPGVEGVFLAKADTFKTTKDAIDKIITKLS